VWGSQHGATLQKGEYFALSVSPGMNAFSWVPAPARGQTLKLDIHPGEEIFLKVQTSGLTAVANGAARKNFRGLQTLPKTRVFDTARVVDKQVIVPIPAVAETIK